MMKDKRDIRPVLFKFGVVLVFSLGGIFFSIFRARRIKPSNPSYPKSKDGGKTQVHHWEARTGLKNVEDHILHKTFNSCCSASIQPGEDQSPRISKSSIGNVGCNFSPRSICTDDKDAYFLPEFSELVKEFDMSAMKAAFSPRKDAENLSIRNPGSDEKVDHELEIRILKNTVKALKERERLLEVQLLDYRGIKEQETAVMELQNRLKINNMEAKLYNLKIETLQADKKRLMGQVADYAKLVSELEAAKVKIKSLKKKLRFEAEQNKGIILALQERVVKLQNNENYALLSSDNQIKRSRIPELEEEAIELKKCNHTLKEENSSLAQKLEYLQTLATSILEDEQGEALKEENRQLRQKNEDMSMEIERLQADHCTDIEELVYLRWINACLRYELRNYQPGSGKTIARDLSKTLSPKSEEKAKQLILEYAKKEGSNGDHKGTNTIGTPDFDSDQWSCSQSNPTDSGDYDDSSIDLSSQSHSRLSRKSKVLGKLMNLLRGKQSHSHSHSHRHRKADASLDTSPHFDVSTGRSSCDLNMKSDNSSQCSSRRSLDLPRYTYLPESRSNKSDHANQVDGFLRNNSDGSSSSISRVIGTISEDSTDLPGEEQQQQHDLDHDQKSDLVKYASALRKIPSDRRLTSYSSF